MLVVITSFYQIVSKQLLYKSINNLKDIEDFQADIAILRHDGKKVKTLQVIR